MQAGGLQGAMFAVRFYVYPAQQIDHWRARQRSRSVYFQDYSNVIGFNAYLRDNQRHEQRTIYCGGNTGLIQLTTGAAFGLDEIMSGSGSLSQYTNVLGCTSATNGIATSFPTAAPGAITPVLGDMITCTITNTRLAGNATLVITKTSTVVSDPVSSANPKAIPGAVIRYTITVQNTGNLVVDANSIIVDNPLPANFTLDASMPFTFTNGSPSSGLNAFNQGTGDLF